MEELKITNEELLHLLIDIAREAGDAILNVYNDPSSIEVQQKSDKSPLTKADKAANDVIVTALAHHFPEIPIISEENKQIEYEERKDFDLYWVVDPLDGTKEFIRRNGEFTVNIALCKKDRPIAGIVSVPVHQEYYYAIRGFGAFKGALEFKKRLNAKSFGMKDRDLTVMVSRSHLNDATESYLAKLNAPKTLPAGSSLKFMRIAEGQADLYPRLGPTMEWDTAAAQIVLEEAGGSLIDWETKSPMKYNKQNLLNPHFVATGDLINA